MRVELSDLIGGLEVHCDWSTYVNCRSFQFSRRSLGPTNVCGEERLRVDNTLLKQNKIFPKFYAERGYFYSRNSVLEKLALNIFSKKEYEPCVLQRPGSIFLVIQFHKADFEGQFGGAFQDAQNSGKVWGL